VRIYVNGKCETSAAYSSGIVSKTGAVYIGTFYDTSYLVNAVIDEVFILNTALSADQIKELYEGRFIGELRPNQYGTTAGLWHLNGNSTDSSGNNNHGTDTAITYSQANGKFGQGAGFNGSSSKVSLGNVASLKPTTAVTVSCWINPTTYANYQAIVVADGASSWTANHGYGLVHLTATNDVSFWINNFSNNVVSGAVVPGGWHHVAGTYDKQNLKLYIDGALIGSDPYTSDIAYSTGAVAIGCGAELGQLFWNGKIDEVMISSTALTANQIRTMYALGVGKYY